MPPHSGAWLVLLLTLASGCTAFTGTESEPRDGGADAVVVDAGVVDAAPPRRVYLPPPTRPDDVYTYVVADGRRPQSSDEEHKPSEPYCLLMPPAIEGAPPRWATCNAFVSVRNCAERASTPEGAACAEYPSAEPRRAMACSFETPTDDGRPTCMPTQYPRSLCEDCGTKTCNVYADGSHECLDVERGDEPSRRLVGVCTRTADGTVFDVGGTPESGAAPNFSGRCLGGTDCFFSVDGEAHCAERAERLARFALRGCEHEAVGDALGCHVRESGEGGVGQYSSDAPTNPGVTYCSARREQPVTPWTDLLWDLTVEAASCRRDQLCNLQDSEIEAQCIEPSWSLNRNDGERLFVCGDCLGVPCFVYEDGSYECTHAPTRAPEPGDDGVPCCRKLPENEGFERGLSAAAAPNNRFDALPACTNAQTRCEFNARGLPECR